MTLALPVDLAGTQQIPAALACVFFLCLLGSRHTAGAQAQSSEMSSRRGAPESSEDGILSVSERVRRAVLLPPPGLAPPRHNQLQHRQPILLAPLSMSRRRKAVEAEILQIAADVFSEKGYRATTLDDIVAAAGFSRATFYSYFPSKEELLRRMYQQVTSSTQAAIERIAAEDLPVPEKLRRIIRYQISYLAEHRPLMRVFFSELLNLPPEMIRSVMQANRAYSRVIERVAAEGVRSGALAPLHPKRVTYAIIGMCNWTQRWYRPEGEWTPEVVADEFIRILEYGYLPWDGEPSTHVLLREVRALRQKIEHLEVALQAGAQPTAQRRQGRRLGTPAPHRAAARGRSS